MNTPTHPIGVVIVDGQVQLNNQSVRDNNPDASGIIKGAEVQQALDLMYHEGYQRGVTDAKTAVSTQLTSMIQLWK